MTVRDLSGQRFGPVVVVREISPRVTARSKSRRFECRCDCGDLCIKEHPGLHRLRTSNPLCGCGHIERRKQYQVSAEGRLCVDCGVWKIWSEYRLLKHGVFHREARCKECYKFYIVKFLYHITREEWEWLLALQDGVCALCGGLERKVGFRLSVDHDHACCGRKYACKKCIRGLLCDLCNSRLLPLVETNARLRSRFLDYLQYRPFIDAH